MMPNFKPIPEQDVESHAFVKQVDRHEKTLDDIRESIHKIKERLVTIENWKQDQKNKVTKKLHLLYLL